MDLPSDTSRWPIVSWNLAMLSVRRAVCLIIAWMTLSMFLVRCASS